jgi:hypothetical protein
MHGVFDTLPHGENWKVEVQVPGADWEDGDAANPRPRHVNQRTARLATGGPPEGLTNAFLYESGPALGRLGPRAFATRFRVATLSEGREVRPAPYYPDPAASLMVLRLAHPGQSEAWFGEPLVVPVGADLYPDAFPVRLEFRATSVRKDVPRLVDGGAISLRAPGLDAATPSIPARSVSVTLAPGETATLNRLRKNGFQNRLRYDSIAR